MPLRLRLNLAGLVEDFGNFHVQTARSANRKVSWFGGTRKPEVARLAVSVVVTWPRLSETRTQVSERLAYVTKQLPAPRDLRPSADAETASAGTRLVIEGGRQSGEPERSPFAASKR
jgi:hypothetical protein